MNSERKTRTIRGLYKCTTIFFACMPLPPLAALKEQQQQAIIIAKVLWRRSFGHSQVLSPLLFVSQFVSQNWIVRVGKVLVWSGGFLVGWLLCPHRGGKRLGIFGKLGYNFGFNCKPILQLTVGNLAAAIFFYIFSSNSILGCYTVYHVYIVSSQFLHSWVINMLPCFLMISIISRDFVIKLVIEIFTSAISCLFLCQLVLQRWNANGKNQPAHTPVHPGRWMVCERETLFGCISILQLTAIVTMVSYVLTIHMCLYLPSNYPSDMTYLLTYIPTQ